MENISIFDMMYDEYKIEKPIKLIELFAGYGSQALALKYLGANFEHHIICEWAVNSIIAYADVHRNELPFYNKDFSQLLTKNEIAEYLFKKGVSIDYSKPATLDQLKRMKEDKLRLCYNSIQCTKNLVDVSRVKGSDLNIVEPENFTYLLTYSFPCQDLSLAGKGAGMEKGSGTRSGLLWEVERILSECEIKPQILLMENVTQVHGTGNDEHFKKWQLRLEEMGYQSYWQDMSAVDYKIPQTRNRTFMISILGNYNFKFPKKAELKLRLKNLLEPEETIKENYYLSESMIDYVSATGTENFNNCDSKVNKKIARPLTTEQNKRAGTTNYIADDLPEETDLSKIRGTKKRAEVLLNLLSANGELEKYDLPNGCDSSLNNPKIREVSNTITTRYDAGIQNQQQIGMCVVEKANGLNNKNIITNNTAKKILTGVDFRNQDFIAIKNASKKGYLLAEEGDGVDISSRMEFHRGNVKKGLSQTITTFGENNGVVVSLKRGYSVEIKKEQEQANNVDYIGNYSKSNFNQTAIVGKNGLAPTVTENHGQVTAINIANLRLRKLTPKECFRLMGLKDEDIDLVMEHQTNASGYHLAGDSIVTTCLMAILGQLVDINYKDKFIPKEWWKNE